MVAVIGQAAHYFYLGAVILQSNRAVFSQLVGGHGADIPGVANLLMIMAWGIATPDIIPEDIEVQFFRVGKEVTQGINVWGSKILSRKICPPGKADSPTGKGLTFFFEVNRDGSLAIAANID